MVEKDREKWDLLILGIKEVFTAKSVFDLHFKFSPLGCSVDSKIDWLTPITFPFICHE